MSVYNFVRNFEFEQAPAHTRELVRTSLLDIIGVAAGASGTYGSRVLREYAAAHYPAGGYASRLLFDGRAVHPLGAAWAGGFSIDTLDAHEGHFGSKGHAGATLVPALLALADAYRAQGFGITGPDLLGILCIGYETALRAGCALVDSVAEYHASGSFSSIGVVCAGARLLGLDETTFRHALGIAEYFSPRCPMMRVIDHPSMLRDAHGAGAYAGINALLLAQAGVSGAPASIVESEVVMCHWHDLGNRWEIDNQYFKSWPVCRWAQPALTAVDLLMSRHREIKADAIDCVRIETFHESARLGGREPANADEAQYALAYPVACLLVRGRLGAEEVSENTIFDEDILAVSRRVRIVEAGDLSERFPQEMLSRVSIRLTDGRCFESPDTPAIGDPNKALSQKQFKEKFQMLASSSLMSDRCEALQQDVMRLGRNTDCSSLFQLLFFPADYTPMGRSASGKTSTEILLE